MPASRVNFNPKWLKSEKVKVAQSVSSSLPHRGLYSPWNSPGQNPGVGSCSLLQGDLPNPGIEPRSFALQGILYQLSHQGSQRAVIKNQRGAGILLKFSKETLPIKGIWAKCSRSADHSRAMEPGRAAAGGRGRGVGSWPGLFWVRGLAHRDTERWRQFILVDELYFAFLLIRIQSPWVFKIC